MYKIIAMEREYGSGGNEIGRRLAKKMGIELYDRTILVEAAKRLGISPIYIENLEETAPGSLIFNLSKTALGGSRKENPNLPMSEQLFLEERDIIQEIVEKESCIIVGRCATDILKDREDCLRVFVRASQDYRIKRAIEAENIAKEEAEEMLRKSDKRRSNFFTTHTGLKWRAMDNYDICLDSESLGIDQCVELLASMMKK